MTGKEVVNLIQKCMIHNKNIPFFCKYSTMKRVTECNRIGRKMCYEEIV